MILLLGFFRKVELKPISIALHAQVAPFDGASNGSSGVVGSVITTNGLKRALQKRHDVDAVEVFYTASYTGYLERSWDFVIIEGWFPSMDQFISLTRNKFRDIKIVFYCLDPEYPGIELVSKFDIDGILTNSRQLLLSPLFSSSAWARRISYMMLAADADRMAPLNKYREYGAVYIGAGGNMLEYKPRLYNLLVDAIPYGLRLHGSNWEHVPVLKDVWKGPLPKDEIAEAYSSAHVVLASTIQSQEQYGMINNRIFEALSCGAVLIVSNFCPSIHEEFGDLILTVNTTHSLPNLLSGIISESVRADRLRREGRELILRKHTWDHRAVELIDFLHQLPSSAAYNQLSEGPYFDGSEYVNRGGCYRPNCPRALVVISDSLRDHSDVVNVILPSLSRSLHGNYRCEYITERDWFRRRTCDAGSQSCGRDSFLAALLIVIVTPLNALDKSLLVLPRSADSGQQKRAAYFLGFDPVSSGDLSPYLGLHKIAYDVIWYRDRFEIDRWMSFGLEFSKHRLQHAFGAGEILQASQLPTASQPVELFICFWHSRQLCSVKERRDSAVVSDDGSRLRLLLLGGEWHDWVNIPGDDNVLEPNLTHAVVHVRDGRIGDSLQMIRSAQHVHILLDAASIIPTADVLWPFVAAAVYGSRIHLARRHDHLLSLVDTSELPTVSDWDVNYLDKCLGDGIDRLLGFGTAESAFRVEAVSFRDGADLGRFSPQELLYLRHLYKSDRIYSVLRLEYIHVSIGRDGQCCFTIDVPVRYSGAPLSEKEWHLSVANSSLCMLRPFRYLVLTANGRDHPLNEHVEVYMYLRGSFYSDVIFSEMFSAHRLSERDLHLLHVDPARELTFSELGYLSNTFFTYNLRKGPTSSN